MNFSRLIKAESFTRGMALSVLYNIISKGILFLLTIIIARYFGSDIKTDIYFFVFASMILFSGFVNSIDSAVLIPESMRLREEEGDKRAAAFLNYFLVIYFFIGVLFTVFMFFFGTRVFGLISKFSAADIETYRSYFVIGSFFFIFHVLTNYLNAILTSLKYFSLPMIISSFKSIIVIVCIFLLKEEYDVMSVILGGLVSYAVNLLIQLYVLKKIARWSFVIGSPGIRRKVWSNVFYAEMGQITTVISSMFPLYLLSGFGSGIISVMNYGKNIADIPNTLVTAQFTNVSGIKLNEQVAVEDYAGMNQVFLKTGKLLVFLLVPMGFYLFVFATPVVELFYQSRNFNSVAVGESAVFLKLLAVTLFSIGINAAVTRIFIATQAIRQAFIYQLLMNIILITAISICTHYYGAYGYPYGVIILNLLNCFTLYFVCRKLVAYIDYMALLKYTGLIIAVNLGIAALLYLGLLYMKMNGVLSLLTGFLLYLIILLGVNKKWKLNTDLSQMINYAKQKFL